MTAGGAVSGSVVDYLLAHRESDAPAVIQANDVITHRQLADRVDEMAVALMEVGVRTGAIVPLIGDNSINWVVWYLAVLRCGATAMPLPGRESSRFLGRALTSTGVQHVLCQPKYLPAIEAIVGAEKLTIWCDKDPGDHGRARTLQAPPLTSIPQWPKIDSATQLASTMMTSGSTGDPKGVCVTHRNIEVNTRSIVSILHLQSDDRMMVVLPFYYCFGLSLLHTHLRAGGSVVLNNAFMFPNKILAEIDRRECTGFAGVPSTYQILLRKAQARRGGPHIAAPRPAGGRSPCVRVDSRAARCLAESHACGCHVRSHRGNGSTILAAAVVRSREARLHWNADPGRAVRDPRRSGRQHRG